jgi:hypothetical protein
MWKKLNEGLVIQLHASYTDFSNKILILVNKIIIN